MSFALCLQIPNHFRFRRLTDFYHGFIPQMLFLQSIFGYLVVCIIYKWLVDWSTSPTPPPSLLNMLIAMFLSPGTIEEGTQLYRGQGFVQTVLILIAAVCVPWMLCVKPYLLWKEAGRVRAQGYAELGITDDGYGPRDEDLEGEEEGHGGAIAGDVDEEHVSSMGSFCSLFHFICLIVVCLRSSTTLVRWSLTRLFTRSSSVSVVYRTRRPTCVSGHCPSHTLSSPRCSGI
jgi:V-type H+-transporting ATPase subunit a